MKGGQADGLAVSVACVAAASVVGCWCLGEAHGIPLLKNVRRRTRGMRRD